MPCYQCDNCHYRFEARKKPAVCSYCNSAGTVDELPTAEDILKENNEVEISKGSRETKE